MPKNMNVGALWIFKDRNGGKHIQGVIELGLLGRFDVVLKRNPDEDTDDGDYFLYDKSLKNIVGEFWVKEHVNSGEKMVFMNGNIQVGLQFYNVNIFKNGFKQKEKQPDYKITMMVDR